MYRRENTEEINKQVQSAVSPLTTVLQEMRNDLRAHITQESVRITSIDDRLDKHSEIYANNGVESKRVADTLSEMFEHSLERDKRVDAMWATFEGDKYAKEKTRGLAKDIMLIAGTIGAIVAIITFLVKISLK